MSSIYAILAYAMAVFNLYRGLSGANPMNIIFAALWLAVGIFCTVKYFKDKKKSDNHQKE